MKIKIHLELIFPYFHINLSEQIYLHNYHFYPLLIQFFLIFYLISQIHFLLL